MNIEKDLNLKESDKLEISIKKKKQIERELVNTIVPFEGHFLWEINKDTLEINKAKFSNTNYQFGGENKKEIQIKDGFAYVSALNKKSALRNFKKGKTGGKKIDPNPMSFRY